MLQELLALSLFFSSLMLVVLVLLVVLFLLLLLLLLVMLFDCHRIGHFTVKVRMLLLLRLLLDQLHRQSLDEWWYVRSCSRRQGGSLPSLRFSSFTSNPHSRRVDRRHRSLLLRALPILLNHHYCSPLYFSFSPRWLIQLVVLLFLFLILILPLPLLLLPRLLLLQLSPR